MFAVAAVKGLIRVRGGHVEEVHDGRRDSVSVTFPSFRCTAKFQHGLSGGPVFDANRFVVGVVPRDTDGTEPVDIIGYAAWLATITELKGDLTGSGR